MSTVCASEYGGPSDPTSGTHGYMGDNLTGRMAFAELGMGTALGGLPHGYKLRITYGGKTVIAEKLDIGLGGPGCGGHTRAIDLWWETARQLGFNGLAPVEVSGGPQVQAQSVSAGGFQNVVATPFGQVGPEIPGEQLVNPFSQLPSASSFFDFLKKFPEIFKLLFGAFKLLFTREGWIRIGKVGLGLFLLLVGILGMAKIEAGQHVVKAGHIALDAAAVAPK